MERHNAEKKQIEREAIRLFIRLHNANYERKLRLLYMQEKPDAVLEDLAQRKLGMEITHLYYDGYEARRVFGRADAEGGSADRSQSIENLIETLNGLIDTKMAKKREYRKDYPVSLLIRNTSNTFGMSDILRVKHRIRHSKELFVDLWFLSRDGGDDWFMYNLDQLLVRDSL